MSETFRSAICLDCKHSCQCGQASDGYICWDCTRKRLVSAHDRCSAGERTIEWLQEQLLATQLAATEESAKKVTAELALREVRALLRTVCDAYDSGCHHMTIGMRQLYLTSEWRAKAGGACHGL